MKMETNNENIRRIAKEKLVERLAKKLSLSSPYAKDLCQDIYVELLRKDEKLIEHLCSTGEIEYYIMKMLKNNVNSTTSPYWKNYEKFRKTTNEIGNETETQC